MSGRGQTRDFLKICQVDKNRDWSDSFMSIEKKKNEAGILNLVSRLCQNQAQSPNKSASGGHEGQRTPRDGWGKGWLPEQGGMKSYQKQREQ